MRCGASNVSPSYPSQNSEIDTKPFLAEALMKITGAYPAFMRPRKQNFELVYVLIFTNDDLYSVWKLQ